MTGHASLPMYDLPTLRPATERWWRGLAGHLRAAGIDGVPERLHTNDDPMTLWRDPELLLSQTCGYPLTHALSGHLQLIATPVYRAPGCDGACYASVILVHKASGAERLDELRGRVCAYNSCVSQSGYNVLRAMIAPLAGGPPFFERVLPTGSHGESARAVGQRRADVCAIDCVTYALMQRYVPALLAGTRTLTWSPKAPGLPYVTRVGLDSETLVRMRAALTQALADPTLAGARDALLIADMVELPLAAYDAIPAMEADARQLGYPALA